MTEKYLHLRALLEAAQAEAINLRALEVAAQVSDLLDQLDFLQACFEAETRPR